MIINVWRGREEAQVVVRVILFCQIPEGAVRSAQGTADGDPAHSRGPRAGVLPGIITFGE